MRYQQVAIALLIALALTIFCILGYKIWLSPDVAYLSPEGEAQWILKDRPLALTAHPHKQSIEAYQHRFETKQSIDNAVVMARAMRFMRVFLDDKLLFESKGQAQQWKQTYQIELPAITPGKHELTFLVMNFDGPPALMAYSPTLDIHTGPHWTISKDDDTQAAVKLATRTDTPAIAQQVAAAYPALAQLPTALVIFSLCLLGYYLYNKYGKPVSITPNAVRLTVLSLFTLVCLNNLFTTPAMGFDYPDHVFYIKYIVEHWSLPSAGEGFQTFQAPFYYLLASLLYSLAQLFLSDAAAIKSLTLISIAAGLLQIELCYRSLKITFPHRADVQIIGVLAGGLLPINVYMSQYLGNEILTGAISATAVYLVLQCIQQPSLILSSKRQVIIGATLGLALLTKVTAILLTIPAILVLLYLLVTQGRSIKPVVSGPAGILVPLLLISSWFYLGHWIEFGKPFISGWDPARGIAWWQDPGYRTASDFSRFGTSLLQPVYSSVYGFWDSIYSSLWLDSLLGSRVHFEQLPPWNFSLLVLMPLLSLPLTIAIVAGFIKGGKDFLSTPLNPIIFSAACVLMYFLAILLMFINLPIYGTAKSFYALGVIPCFALLISAGYSMAPHNATIKSVTYSLIVTWSTCSLFAYIAI